MPTTIWILGDQLTHEHLALSTASRREARVLMIESRNRGSVHRYHKLKLVLVYSAMRHFAEELRARGWQVDYYRLEQGHTFAAALDAHLRASRSDTVTLAEPNSFAETTAIEAIAAAAHIPLEFVPTTQFLLPRGDFAKWARGKRRLLMEQHYRRMRERFHWLVDDAGRPAGKAWNFDAENRRTFASWRRAGAPAPAGRLVAEPDDLTREVMAMVDAEFADHPGRVDEFWLPVDRTAALAWLDRFIVERLPAFGPFQDVMAEHEPFLLHSVLSPAVNLGLLSPRECVEAAVAAYARGDAPLASVEGYVRQLVGWREFINGVYWLRGPEYGGLNALGATRALPRWFYTGDTPMNCLHHVLRQTLRLGWNHHIERLMVLGNFLLVAGISPQAALRWFLEMYVDAYDWVMAPNVIGMSQHADDGYMATKPYAATSAYIRKMSNYCAGCRYDPDQKTGPDACPFNYLYWDFIDRHADRFRHNARMLPIVRAWSQRGEAGKSAVRTSASEFMATHVAAERPRA